jgi:PAS domain S-box-containing protein
MSDPHPANPPGRQTTKASWTESVWARYALAVVAVAVCTALTYTLRREVSAPSARVIFAFFYLAVFVSVWFGGRGPGLAAIALSVVVADTRFLPEGLFAPDRSGIIPNFFFISTSFLAVLLIERSRRSEMAAHEARVSLETTLKSIGDAVISTDTSGRVVFMNKIAERLTGWPISDARGRTLAEVFHIINEHTRAVVESPADKVLRGGQVVGLANHTLLIARDGTETPIDDSGAPVKNERGQVSGVVLVFHDITERRRAETTRTQLAAIVESSDDAIIGKTLEGIITSWNAAATRMYGYEAEEAVGHHISLVVPPERMEELADIMSKLKRGESIEHHETVRLRKDGARLSVAVTVSPVRDSSGRVVGASTIARDITEQKLAEERLRESEERLSTIASTASDAIITIDETSTILFANQAAERIFGHAVVELTGQHLTMLMPDYLRHAHESALQRYLETGRRHMSWESVALPGLHKNGKEISLEVSFAEFVKDGKRYFTGIARDIGERLRLTQMVERERERLKELIGNVPGVVWEAWGAPDEESQRIDFVSDYVERMLGYTVEEWLQTPNFWLSIVHPVDRERAATEARAIFESGEGGVSEFRWVRKDGAVVPVEAQSIVALDERGRPAGMRGVTMDITERKQSQERMAFLAAAGEALSSSLVYETTLERLARLAVSELADYCLIDLVGDDGDVRRVATAHADAEQDPLLGELRRFPPDLSKLGGVAEVLRTGETMLISRVDDEQLDSITRSPEHRRLLERLGLKSFMTIPLVTRERTIGALTLALTTGARSYTQSDVAFAEELARRAALAIENARLYSRAQEVNRTKDEFLATLSHELRTPLTPIIGWTHMIRSGRMDDAATTQGLDVIEKNAQALSRLINDLLDMSSILSNKMRIERAPVELSSVVRAAVETVEPRAASRGVLLEVSYDDGGAGVRLNGDRTRLVQVFWNLLDNAVKFSPEGGRVRVRVETNDGTASVCIEDEGEGIEPEFLPHIFERFRQADMGTTRRHGGLGIGLALVKSFVEAHAGRVEVESAGEGRGCSFRVTFPVLQSGNLGAKVDESDAVFHQSAIRNPQSATPERRVLVVEDAPDTLEMLRVVLSARGYVPVTCANAEEALRVAESARFDIIVSDIGLPQVDGYELIERLRRLPHMSETPALALTGYAAAKDAEAALAAGFDAHVAKPVEPSVLATEMERLLRRVPKNDER